MAHEEGLPPLVRSAEGRWSVEAPPPDELHEFAAIAASGERKRLVQDAKAFLNAVDRTTLTRAHESAQTARLIPRR